MNRNVFFKCVMAFAIFVFGLYVGCGNKTSETSETSETATIDKNEYIRKASDALKKGDYAEAYVNADQMIATYGRSGYDLNRKILTNEIASNVDEGKTAGIILCIKERAKYNSSSASSWDKEQKEAEIEMLRYAIQIANTVENGGMAKKLQNTLKTWEKEEK